RQLQAPAPSVPAPWAPARRPVPATKPPRPCRERCTPVASRRPFHPVLLEHELRLASEDDDVALVLDPEALGPDGAEWAMALDRIVALRAAFGHVDMGAIGDERVALVLEHLDVAEKVEQLRLRAIDACVGGEREPAALGRHIGLGSLELDEVVHLR